VYDVTLQKQNYLSWSNRVYIQRNVVTKIDSTLLPAQPKTSKLTDFPLISAVEPGGKGRVAFVVRRPDTQELMIHVADSTIQVQTVARLVDRSAEPWNLSWASSGRYIALWQPSGALIVLRVSDGELVFQHMFSPLKKVGWPIQNDNFIVALSAESMSLVDTLAGTVRIIASPNIQDFVTHDNDLWVLRSSPNVTTLELLNPFGVNEQRQVFQLERPLATILTAAAEGVMLSGQQTVSWLNLRDGQFYPEHIEQAEQALLSADGQHLAVRSASEVWHFSLSKNEWVLLVRAGRLTDVIWHPSATILLAVIDGRIRSFSPLAPTAVHGAFMADTTIERLHPWPPASIVVVDDQSVTAVSLK